MSSSSEPSSAKEPPLSLSTVRVKFPNLFQVYSNISSRELEIADNVDNFADICGETPIDAATGLATKIMGVDFTQPLEETPDGAPIKANSDANKFGLFLWVNPVVLEVTPVVFSTHWTQPTQILRRWGPHLHNFSTCWDGISQ